MTIAFHPEKKYPIQENVNYAASYPTQAPPSYGSGSDAQRYGGYSWSTQYSDSQVGQQRQHAPTYPMTPVNYPTTTGPNTIPVPPGTTICQPGTNLVACRDARMRNRKIGAVCAGLLFLLVFILKIGLKVGASVATSVTIHKNN